MITLTVSNTSWWVFIFFTRRDWIGRQFVMGRWEFSGFINFPLPTRCLSFWLISVTIFCLSSPHACLVCTCLYVRHPLLGPMTKKSQPLLECLQLLVHCTLCDKTLMLPAFYNVTQALWGKENLIRKNSVWGLKLTTHLHLVPRLATGGYINDVSPYASKACRGTNLLFTDVEFYSTYQLSWQKSLMIFVLFFTPAKFCDSSCFERDHKLRDP
jgi:hypothetical protein